MTTLVLPEMAEMVVNVIAAAASGTASLALFQTIKAHLRRRHDQASGSGASPAISSADAQTRMTALRQAAENLRIISETTSKDSELAEVTRKLVAHILEETNKSDRGSETGKPSDR
jgi:predicted negative regulator of RcsB-dependent stress response